MPSALSIIEKVTLKFQRNCDSVNRNTEKKIEMSHFGWRFCGFNAVTFKNNNERKKEEKNEEAKSNLCEGEKKSAQKPR